MREKLIRSLTCLAAVLFATTAMAQEPDKKTEITPITIAEGLNNPSGVAVQPGTGHVFVADSGALRIIRIVDGKVEPVITDFPKDVYGKGPIYDIGPLGLLFIDKDTLMVGGGGKVDGEELLRVFKVPAAGSPPIKADKTHGEPMKLEEKGDTPGEGNFYGLAKGATGVFVTCNGDDKKGWISKAVLEEGKLKSFERAIATKEAVKVDAPVAITMNPESRLAVGQMGEINVPGDSLLTFYKEDGEQIGKIFKIGLHDITGLAYGPKAQRLFATDFNWTDPDNGGLYKIVAADNPNGCESWLLLKLRKPTALAFAPNGDLYVTLAGDSSENAPKPDGKLIKIEGLDVVPKDQE